MRASWCSNSCHPGAQLRRLEPGRRPHPNAKIPTIAAAVASGVNMNEWVRESIECSGAETEPFTDAQFEVVARLVAAASKATGLPINRGTVVVHADINSVSRRSDPWPPATRGALVKRVTSRANAILRPPITSATVNAGDSLSAIASAHRLTLKTLLAFPENARYRAEPGLIHPGRHRPREVTGGAAEWTASPARSGAASRRWSSLSCRP
jgi:hypothetical protein